MEFRRYALKHLLAIALPVAASLVAVAWLAAEDAGATGLPRPSGRVVFAIILLTVAVTALLAALQARRLAGLLLRMTRAFRRLAVGEQVERIPLAGAREFQLLGRALDDTRARIVAQVRTIDRQRRLLEALLRQLREGVIVAGPTRNVALINPAAVRLLGIRVEGDGSSLVGMAIERCVPQLELQRLLSVDEGGGRGSEVRLQIETHAGTLHLLAIASDIMLPHDEPEEEDDLGRLLVLTDITALTRTIQMKTDFVANASHELRTPLSTIMAAVETLEKVDSQEEFQAARRYVEVIDRQCRRLHALATDLLELSRLEADAARFLPCRVHLGELLEELRTRFATHVTAKGVDFQIDLSRCPDPYAFLNPQLLGLVLDNLVDNAVKFTDAGKRVSVSVRRDESGVTFEVADEGCGIPPEEQERVFERFYQVQRARSGVERGTGLGLSIVRHAVNAMRARVQLNSRIGAGTRVCVTIPQDPAMGVDRS